MKNVVYDVVDRGTNVSLVDKIITDREEARANKQLLKLKGLDAVIVQNKVGVVSSKVIR